MWAAAQSSNMKTHAHCTMAYMLEIEFDGHVARFRGDGAHVGHHEKASHDVAHREL